MRPDRGEPAGARRRSPARSPGVTGPGDAPARTRQARLHQAFAHLYPGIPPAVWLHAATVMDMVWVLQLKRGVAAAQLRARALDPVHFEFRYGEPLPTMDRMGRATDRL
jgi:hypothetical protein